MADYPPDYQPGKLSGAQTTSETIDYRTLVAEFEGELYPFFEHPAYEFSKKVFWEDDNSGIYQND